MSEESKNSNLEQISDLNLDCIHDLLLISIVTMEVSSEILQEITRDLQISCEKVTSGIVAINNFLQSTENLPENIKQIMFSLVKDMQFQDRTNQMIEDLIKIFLKNKEITEKTFNTLKCSKSLQANLNDISDVIKLSDIRKHYLSTYISKFSQDDINQGMKEHFENKFVFETTQQPDLIELF